MKFSENGYYVEKYLKCENCGELIYQDYIKFKESLYCCKWCKEWDLSEDIKNDYKKLAKRLIKSHSQKISEEDMVNMSIIDSVMVSICREMGISLMKTSYSTIFNEGLDFTCALADINGDMIAVAEFCPAQIGGMPLLIKTCVQEISIDQINPGDVIMHNDPYRGGLHTPEHTFFKPFYIDNELMGFAVCIGHIAEIGGMVPGAFAGEATEIFHEGLRVPPIKIKSRDIDNDEVWKLLLANVRTPRHNYGDLRAMIGAVDLGEKRIIELINKYGKATFNDIVIKLMNYSEIRMKNEIKNFKNGIYSFKDTIENDGIENKEYDVSVDVYVSNQNLVADFRKSSNQAKGPINATLGVTIGATYNAILHMTDPTIPKNSGCFRPIKILSPPNKVTNVDYPAPEVAGNTETHPRLAGIVIGALAKCYPDRAMAAESATGNNFVFGGSDPDLDEYFACYDIMSGGWGGRSFADGNDAVIAINGNCRYNPTEVFETRYPWLVEEFALVKDSGGPGKYRGGMGFTRTLLSTKVEITVSQCTDRHRIKPFGLFKGKEGSNGATLIKKKGSKKWLNVCSLYNKNSSSKFSNIIIKPGDRVKLTVPGGGGYGDPNERDKQKVEMDVIEGYISKKHAWEEYKYEKY